MAELPDNPGERAILDGSVVYQIENDTMRAVSLQKPRVEAEVKAKLLDLIRGDADFAATIYYSIPYKNHVRRNDRAGTSCTGQADDPCEVRELVEGVGIDGARELARLWGNNQSRVYFTGEDDDWVDLQGVFIDLETNVRIEVPFRVAKLGSGSTGTWTLNPQKLGQAVQAGVSKVARNAILQGTPAYIQKAMYSTARETLGAVGELDIPSLLEAFLAFEINRVELEAFFGSTLEELDVAGRRRLRGMFTALREGITTKQKLFEAESPSSDRGPASPAAPAPEGSARVTAGTQADTASNRPDTDPSQGVESDSAESIEDHDPSLGI